MVRRGTTWNLFDYGTRRPGLSLLLAPGFALTDDASTVYRTALFLNPVLAGASVVALIFVIRRLTGWTSGTATMVAVGVALAPTSVAASSTVWAEPLTTLTFLLTLFALMRFFELPGIGRAMIATGAAAAGFLAHSRLLPLIPVAVLLTVITLARRRDLGGAVVVTLWSFATTIVMVIVSGAAIDHVWTEPTTTNDAGEVAKRLDAPLAIIDAAIGQLWYLLAATFGVVAFGTVELVRLAVGRDRPDRRTGALLVIALTTPLLAVSALFMSDRPRADHLVYGRYNDAVLWPIVALGVAWIGHNLWDAQRARSRDTIATVVTVAALLLVTAAAVHQWHAADLRSRITLTHMVPGIVWLSPQRGTIEVWPTTLAALVVMAIGFGAVVLRRRVPWLVPVVVVTVLAAGGLRARIEFGTDANALTIASVVTETTALLPDGEQVGYSLSQPSPEITLDNQRAWAQAYQFYLPEHEFLLDGGPDDVGPYVFAPFDDAVMSAIGAEEIWTDPRSGISLWREPRP
ncbi:hypothetical protein [Ilumatobacter sp.]|uniref:hypothetical protein n=1 Tax=Ilumatobacter sp. TaxID=1967498 RepID=UPI003AF6A002